MSLELRSKITAKDSWTYVSEGETQHSFERLDALKASCRNALLNCIVRHCWRSPLRECCQLHVLLSTAFPIATAADVLSYLMR